MDERIRIFDTTLRDGEQSPGFTMNTEEKLEVARALAAMRVDVIEAGFPISSKGDLEGVQLIAREVRGATIAGLARANRADIDAVVEGIRDAERPRIHTFIATSPIHMEHKLRMTPDQVYEASVDAVRHARRFAADVEFSAEDASRSDPEFLCRVFDGAIAAGASTINVPDTVGYATPEEYAALIRSLIERIPNSDKVIWSVHCHDDLGLAVANSLAAVQAGARQIECTVNGIGERAGNASLEEIVMALHTRRNYYRHETAIDTTKIYRTSRLISAITGIPVQPNKAVVGDNAFAHEAGIHQHGVLANRETYEIMTPETIGVPGNKLVLGKHSGRHALKNLLETNGVRPSDAVRQEEAGDDRGDPGPGGGRAAHRPPHLRAHVLPHLDEQHAPAEGVDHADARTRAGHPGGHGGRPRGRHVQRDQQNRRPDPVACRLCHQGGDGRDRRGGGGHGEGPGRGRALHRARDEHGRDRSQHEGVPGGGQPDRQ